MECGPHLPDRQRSLLVLFKTRTMWSSSSQWMKAEASKVSQWWRASQIQIWWRTCLWVMRPPQFSLRTTSEWNGSSNAISSFKPLTICLLIQWMKTFQSSNPRTDRNSLSSLETFLWTWSIRPQDTILKPRFTAHLRSWTKSCLLNPWCPCSTSIATNRDKVVSYTALLIRAPTHSNKNLHITIAQTKVLAAQVLIRTKCSNRTTPSRINTREVGKATMRATTSNSSNTTRVSNTNSNTSRDSSSHTRQREAGEPPLLKEVRTKKTATTPGSMRNERDNNDLCI